MKSNKLVFILLASALIFSGCNLPANLTPEPPSISTVYAELLQTMTPGILDTPSPGNPDQILTISPTEVPNSSEAENPPKLFLHPGLPKALMAEFDLSNFDIVTDEADAELRILVSEGSTTVQAEDETSWIFAVAAPFYTIQDEISASNLSKLWLGESPNDTSFDKIMLTAETKAAMITLFGQPDESVVNVIESGDYESWAASTDPFLAILPFEALTPRWKVLQLDGRSPINDDFDPRSYPLTTEIWIEGDLGEENISFPASNYHKDQRTVLIMTGVTALTRATAHQMEVRGNRFPGQDIQQWLNSADITHISNEVPFAVNCPSPDPNQQDLIFCSSPDRIELLDYVGADIIELSGNHMLDYGIAAMNLTLEMYENRGWLTYAGGWDLDDSRTPAKITHNGNKLAFLGCNPVGPPNAWATASQPGSAPCGNFEWMETEIQQLHSEGYLPIVTLQYAEDYTGYPGPQMVKDFTMLADFGAIVVNGSQAHTPKIMTFYEDSFLHYGLGNLFFDQMHVYYSDVLMQGTREEFIDRLVFYDGKLISIELLTAMLEDYARPRPMTVSERESLLSRIFDYR